jgi:cob(I)alamin adenosyltransferase
MSVKIYTKTGDKGETGLFGGERVEKTNIRVEAYGTVDELNAAIGVVVAQLNDLTSYSEIKDELETIMHDLYDIGALLATPKNTKVNRGQLIHQKLPLYLNKRTEKIEKAIDAFMKKVPPLQAFILPGGGRTGSLLHQVRTICRRAERRVVALSKEDTVPVEILVYMNRLSDLFFALALFVNHKENKKEILWNKRGTF